MPQTALAGSTAVDPTPSVSAETAAERIERRKVDKFAERRAQLAEATLSALSEFGYARTSLREIAQRSGFSHGVLHYYFRDKVDLITYCVREYKALCVAKYDQIVATATSAEQVRGSFAAALAASSRDDAPMHRLWYDLRTQSFFETDFRADVTEIDQSLERMIWRILTTYAALSNDTIALDSGTSYAMLDGLFQRALLGNAFGDADAVTALQDGVVDLLPRLLSGCASAA